jgi:hypothetical protein
MRKTYGPGSGRASPGASSRRCRSWGPCGAWTAHGASADRYLFSNRLQSAFGSLYAQNGARRPAMHHLEACRRPSLTSEKGRQQQRRRRIIKPGAKMPCSQREPFFSE